MMPSTLSIAADYLRLLNVETTLSGDGSILEVVPGSVRMPISAVSATAERDPGGKLAWVTVRARGTQTRAVFPTKKPEELPKAVAKNVLAALLDLATLVAADAILEGLFRDEGEARGG